jgi:hypothetical protein
MRILVPFDFMQNKQIPHGEESRKEKREQRVGVISLEERMCPSTTLRQGLDKLDPTAQGTRFRQAQPASST